MSGIQLVSDIGGTFARLAVFDPIRQSVSSVQKLEVASFDTFESGLQQYLNEIGNPSLAGICVAAAGPLRKDSIFRFLNNHWLIDTDKVAKQHQCRFELINDFTAQALGVSLMGEGDLLSLQKPDSQGDGFDSEVQLCIGPGTGFGTAAILQDGDVLPSEAGHVSFAPLNQQEFDILRYLQVRYQRVSVERLISGNGLANIANALAWSATGKSEPVEGNIENAVYDSPKTVVSKATEGDAICIRAIEQFLKTLADVAGDLTLTLCASKVYLCGGVLPRLLDFLNAEQFKQHFINKGRYGEICQAVSVDVVVNDQVGLFGCGVRLNS
jgi:glucokinase